MIFNLYPLHRLNITFYHIQINYMNLYKCFIGNVSIISNNKYIATFCGIHSQLLNYPPNKEIEIYIVSSYRVYQNILLHYSVIDKGKISTFLFDYLPIALSTTTWNVYFVQFQITILHVHIVILKYQIISVIIQNEYFSLVQLHDGPGVLAKILTPVSQSKQNSTYHTSSFQCLMSVKLQGPNTPYQLFKYLPLTRKLSHEITSVESQVKLIQYPHMCNGCSLLQFHVQTTYHHNINITTNNLSYIGHMNILCQYAGLAVFDKKQGAYKELTTVCYAHKGYTYRNVYTKGFEAILVFYSYPMYGAININVSISVTVCKVIAINTCVFDTKCQILGNYCNTLRTIMSQENFESDGISNPVYAIYGKGFLKVRVKEKHCTIFQLFHNTDQYLWFPTPHDIFTDGMRLRLCRLPNFKLVSEIGRNIHYTITGYLSGKIS